jgi:methyl-accepting chemotaxis protein
MIIDRARADKSPIFFSEGSKDAVAFYYSDKNASFVIIAAAYDETGNERMRHLRLVLTLSFVGGILISVIGGYLFSISLLRPLRRITDEVNEISARNLARRVRSAGRITMDRSISATNSSVSANWPCFFNVVLSALPASG